MDPLSTCALFEQFLAQRRYLKNVTPSTIEYVRVCDNFLNPEDQRAPLLLLQAHASYRAAVGLAMSGQSAPAFMAMRGCLESSLYGLYFNRNPDSFHLWLSRHDDDTARRSVKVEFTIRNLKDCLQEADPGTNAIVAQLYDRTIDYGAHPNVGALASAFRSRTVGDRTHFDVAYLTADPQVLVRTMKSVAQTGVCSLMIFRNALAERFDLLGITESLAALRQKL